MTQAKNLAQIDYAKVAQGLEEPIEDWKNWLEDRGLIAVEPIDTFTQEIPEVKEELVVTEWINLDSIKLAQGDTTAVTGTQLAILVNVNHADAEEPLAQKGEDKSFFEEAQENIIHLLNPSRITGLFSSVIGFFGNLLIAVMSILFISFFFLREQGLFDRMIGSIVPNRYEGETVTAINESSSEPPLE